jgi:hypothetical protein
MFNWVDIGTPERLAGVSVERHGAGADVTVR